MHACGFICVCLYIFCVMKILLPEVGFCCYAFLLRFGNMTFYVQSYAIFTIGVFYDSAALLKLVPEYSLCLRNECLTWDLLAYTF